MKFDKDNNKSAGEPSYLAKAKKISAEKVILFLKMTPNPKPDRNPSSGPNFFLFI